jgi:hypothetical protein
MRRRSKRVRTVLDAEPRVDHHNENYIAPDEA